jgi:hypothetical protein
MEHRVWFAWCLALLLPSAGFAQPAQGQPSERRWVYGSALVTGQAAGRRDCPYLCGPLGGRGIGASLGLGVHGTDRLALVFEVARAARLEGRQHVRAGNLDVLAQHRDTLVSSGISVSWPGGSDRVTTTTVALVGIAVRHTTRTGTTRSGVGGEPQPYDRAIVDTVPHLGAGLGLTVWLTEHLSLVPSLRMHYLFDRDEVPGGPPRRGVSRGIAAGGVGLAMRF